MEGSTDNRCDTFGTLKGCGNCIVDLSKPTDLCKLTPIFIACIGQSILEVVDNKKIVVNPIDCKIKCNGKVTTTLHTTISDKYNGTVFTLNKKAYVALLGDWAKSGRDMSYNIPNAYIYTYLKDAQAATNLLYLRALARGLVTQLAKEEGVEIDIDKMINK